MSGTGNTTSVIRKTGSSNINGVLGTYSWDDPTITYSFPTDRAQYNGYETGEHKGIFGLSAPIKKVVHAAFNTAYANAAQDGFSVEGFTRANFSVTTAKDAHVRVAHTRSDPFKFGTAWAYAPGNDENAGDVWFSNRAYDYSSAKVGNYAHYTILHELGHTLGLDHGHAKGTFGALAKSDDSMEYTVMTYRPYVGGPTNGFTNETYGYAQSWMMLDIAALQHLYGADYTTNSGNTTYSWKPGSGNTFVNGAAGISPGANKIFATIWDGGGIDTYDLSAYKTNVRINLAPGQDSVFSNRQLANLGDGHKASGNIFNAFLHQGDKRSLIENAIGGGGNDVIFGNLGHNKLSGGGGADRLFGRAGNDRLLGNSGSDKLSGEGGNDRLYGGGGNDVLGGGNGNDVLYGGSGADSLWGGNGADRLDGSLGHDALRGGSGEDRISGGAGQDKLWGGAHGDDLRGGSGRDAIFGEAGDDSLFGNGGADRIRGGAANDRVHGGAGHDNLAGNGGSDTVSGGSGNDILTGNGGADLLLGGGGADTLRGGSGLDRLFGGGGLDRLWGGNHGDKIHGGAGRDTIFGEAGRDSLYGNGSADSIRGGGGNDRIFGGGGRDNLSGNGGNDVIFGGSGNDILTGNGGRDSLTGNGGADIFRFLKASDSRPGANRDQIEDFTSGRDMIDLGSMIHGTFKLKIGGSFTGNGPSVTTSRKNGDVIVSADLNGDRKTDFQVLLEDAGRVSADDFIL